MKLNCSLCYLIVITLAYTGFMRQPINHMVIYLPNNYSICNTGHTLILQAKQIYSNVLCQGRCRNVVRCT